jgi:hypothetical protein
LKQLGEAMIHSSRGKPKAKGIAEVLAVIADALPDLVPHHTRPVRETDEPTRRASRPVFSFHPIPSAVAQEGASGGPINMFGFDFRQEQARLENGPRLRMG